jgi:modulator of FtsH protease
MTAFGGTAIVVTAMATVATVSKRDFSGLGKWLFVGVLVILVAALANIFLQLPALQLTISVVAIAIFSAFILYDVQRIVNGGETNYITATLALYLSVYNIFANLLSLLGIFGGERD